ncbi:DNA repair protein RecO [Virgibacillus halophilus]|uniref:DNA repair protein RecO n=1 Tax=Tigheibacillus halophilus TaxID=361280 RepID=UPI00362552E8
MLDKVKGIVIRTQDYGETNKIVTIYSANAGKVSAVARGAKKPKSRMAAVTQPFIYGEFMAYLSSGLGTIQQAEVIHSFREIRQDIFKTAYASYILELTDKLVENRQGNAFLFQQLYLTLEWIAAGKDMAVPIMMYELKLYAVSGFAPVVHHCVSCESKQFPFAFSIAEGGLLCPKCRYKDPHAIGLPDAVAKLLHLFTKADLKRVGQISVKPDNLNRLRMLLDAYYDQYGGYFLKTKRFLNQLDKLK